MPGSTLKVNIIIDHEKARHVRAFLLQKKRPIFSESNKAVKRSGLGLLIKNLTSDPPGLDGQDRDLMGVEGFA